MAADGNDFDGGDVSEQLKIHVYIVSQNALHVKRPACQHAIRANNSNCTHPYVMRPGSPQRRA
jgi:hypothetical protein